jgi:hypothetical protein
LSVMNSWRAIKVFGREKSMRDFTIQIRRDQHAICCASRAARRPCFPLADARSTPQSARSSRAAIQVAASAAGFRLRLGGGVALRLRSSRLSVCAPLFPLADRRPKPCQIASAIDAGKFQAHTSSIVANRKRKSSRVKE